MEFADAVRRRKMVRSFAPDRPVSDQDQQELIKVALRAPSAGFTQGVSLLILETAADRARFWDASSAAPAESAWLRGMRSAPLLILVWASEDAYLDRYAEADKGWTDRDRERWTAPYWFVDAGMASMSVLLSVVDHDLGACFFGVPPERVDAVRQAFAVPQEQLSVGVIAVGYPDPAETPLGSPRRRPRKTSETLIHRSAWSD